MKFIFLPSTTLIIMKLLFEKTFVADDHEIVAKGLAALVKKVIPKTDIEIAKNGDEVIRKVLTSPPSLLILDIEMPVLDGLEALKTLRERGYRFPVLMLSMVGEQAVIQEAIDLGADGYLHKDCSEDELREALESVVEGSFYLSKEAKKAMLGLKRFKSGMGDQELYKITKRESEVLQLICEGLTSKKIGEKLFISARTVESHKENLMHKLGVNSSAKLVAKALKRRLV